MQKRNITSIILLDVMTLGFYELYWLTKIRSEITHTFRLKIPSARWLVMGKAVQIACVLLTAYVVLVAMPANKRRIDNIQHPSATCFYENARSSDNVRAGGQPTVNQSCKDQIATYFHTDNTARLLLGIVGVYILSFILMSLLLKRWYLPFAEAIAKATKQKINSTNAIILLTAVPSPLGVIKIQSAFNSL